jgi:predicted alpha/beta-hydrolase family hydrolase
MVQTAAQEIRFIADDKAGEVGALLMLPTNSKSLLVLAHGAGAGMRHRFLEALCSNLAALGVATFRYQFPYIEKGLRRPDPPAILTSTVRSAVAVANKHAKGLPLFAGGKSLGGRMTSLAAATESLEQVRGLVFLGFPLHAAGRPSSDRGQHLAGIKLPMLFLQGSRDPLADLEVLKPLCSRLGKRAEMLIVEGGDHSFHMLKSSGRSDDEVLENVALKISSWIDQGESKHV